MSRFLCFLLLLCVLLLPACGGDRDKNINSPDGKPKDRPVPASPPDKK